MHVQSISLSVLSFTAGWKKAEATVTILDNLGNPVSDANVTGTFTGSWNETISAATNASGEAVLITNTQIKGRETYSFCVDNVTHASLTYAPGDNVVTCSSW